MLVAIHQLHYLPWLRYFEKAARAGVFVVLDDIQYNKNGWQNRNKVKGPAGELLLTVPVHAPFQARLDEITIANRPPWRKKHWRTVAQCYAKAPFFERYAPALEAFYCREWGRLNDLNREMLAFFLDALGIRTPVRYSSELAVPGEATERLANLVRAVGGDAYYSGAHALDVYLDAASLEEAGVRLELQHWRAPVYPQLHGAFAPDLSILDLLMNCGPESKAIILGAGNDSA